MAYDRKLNILLNEGDEMKINNFPLKFLTSIIFLFIITLFLSGCAVSLVELTRQKKYEEIRMKLEKGADANEVDKETGMTPLIFSVINEDIPILDLLLKNGANVNSRGKMEKPPLFYAISTGNIEIIEKLLRNGANVNDKYTYRSYEEVESFDVSSVHIMSKDLQGTPLIDTLYREKSMEIIKLLIEYGADVNIGNSHNKTPLVFAVEQNRADHVKYLLEKGANPNVEYTYISSKGYLKGFSLAYVARTPINIYSQRSVIELARSKWYSEIIELLKQFGAKN